MVEWSAWWFVSLDMCLVSITPHCISIQFGYCFSTFIVMFYVRFVTFLDAFATLRKVNIKFIISVLPSRWAG